MHYINFEYVDVTASNRATGAEQNGECWYSTSNRVNMATEVGKELRSEDVPLCLLEH
jgi:hypothetical protein